MSDQNTPDPTPGDPNQPPSYGAPQTPPPSYGAPQTPPPGYGAPQTPPPAYGSYQQQPQQFGGGTMTPSDENTWSALGHFGGIILGFVAPLIVMLVKGPESPRVRSQAVEALNFQISMMIYMFVSAILTIVLVGIIGIIVFGLMLLICSILAGVKALNGEDYRYPLTIRMVK
ncbi:MAG: DUF4870 domain-containing protein [Nocardioides sp.]|uniref:DUF4870 domain-containing protein n=1 Tax=Nocardioides sp. TaxID=35761 RepID=UPI003F0BEB70